MINLRSLGISSAAAFLLLACGGAQNSVRVDSNTTEAPVIAHARTYAIGAVEQAPPRYRSSANSAEAAKHIRPYLEEALKAKGYTPAASVADADLVWMYAAGRREREKPVQQPQSRTGDSYPTDDPDEEFEEGAVVIDALDKNGARAWHGFGRTEIDPNKVNDALLKKTVDKIMQRFPAAAPVAAAAPAATPPAAPAPAKQ